MIATWNICYKLYEALIILQNFTSCVLEEILLTDANYNYVIPRNYFLALEEKTKTKNNGRRKTNDSGDDEVQCGTTRHGQWSLCDWRWHSFARYSSVSYPILQVIMPINNGYELMEEYR